MLYNLVVGILILAFAIPVLCLMSFRLGFRYGSDGKAASEAKIVPTFRKKNRNTSKEMERVQKISQNVENYSGDATNQVKV